MGEGWSFLNSKQGYHGMAYCRKDTVQVLHEISFNVLFMVFVIWDTLRDLVPFVQYKNVIDTISKVESCNLTKSSTPLWGVFFFMFLRFYKWYQLAQSMFSRNIWLLFLFGLLPQSSYCAGHMMLWWEFSN